MPPDTPVLVTAAEMRALEQAAVAAGTTEDALMERAGAGLAEIVRQFWPRPGFAVIFCGKGHNAGDACVLARHLLTGGWRVEVRAAYPPWSWRSLAREKFSLIEGKVTTAAVAEAPSLPSGPVLLVDGLLGTGAGGALKDPVLTAARTINSLRSRCAVDTLAIDLPTGLDSDSGTADPDTVRADVTATLGFPKQGLCAPGAEDFAGRLALIPLALPLPDNPDARAQCITPALLHPLLQRRPFSMHKGQAGRVGIVAGSRGFVGAARLTAAAATAAGGGLVTLFCPHDIYEILAAACPPEVMVQPVHSCREVMAWNLDAIGIGPGIGKTPLSSLPVLLRDDPRPVVVDADALNAMAAYAISLHDRSGGPRLLTPHPGELARLAVTFAPNADDPAVSLAGTQRAVVLSKGARTRIVDPDHPPLHNTTGHPMLAKGGFGDILTGFCTAFAARGTPLRECAALASWLLGRAAEIARGTDGDAVESFTPTRLLEMTGPAFASLRAHRPGTG